MARRHSALLTELVWSTSHSRSRSITLFADFPSALRSVSRMYSPYETTPLLSTSICAKTASQTIAYVSSSSCPGSLSARMARRNSTLSTKPSLSLSHLVKWSCISPRR